MLTTIKYFFNFVCLTAGIIFNAVSLTVSNANPIQFWDINDDTFNEKDVCSIYSCCFRLPYQCDDDVAIQALHTAGQTVTLGIYDSENFDGGSIDTKTFSEIASGIYLAEFDFSEVCSNDVRLKILANGTPLMKSDIIKARELHECTSLITYSNSKLYAGLDYVSGTPPPEFNIRIPSIFFEEAFPDEHEEIDLSDSQSVRLLNIEKRQRKLDIDFMPFYMHQKMKLILSHDTIEIDGQSWLRTEPYEITDGNKRYPMRKASCVLNDKNYIVRNVL